MINFQRHLPITPHPSQVLRAGSARRIPHPALRTHRTYFEELDKALPIPLENARFPLIFRIFMMREIRYAQGKIWHALLTLDIPHLRYTLNQIYVGRTTSTYYPD